jgi:hypothetical protein
MIGGNSNTHDQAALRPAAWELACYAAAAIVADFIYLLIQRRALALVTAWTSDETIAFLVIHVGILSCLYGAGLVACRMIASSEDRQLSMNWLLLALGLLACYTLPVLLQTGMYW